MRNTRRPQRCACMQTQQTHTPARSGCPSPRRGAGGVQGARMRSHDRQCCHTSTRAPDGCCQEPPLTHKTAPARVLTQTAQIAAGCRCRVVVLPACLRPTPATSHAPPASTRMTCMRQAPWPAQPQRAARAARRTACVHACVLCVAAQTRPSTPQHTADASKQ